MVKVYYLQGEDTKAQLELKKGQFCLGRSVKELQCPDKKVSREHATIELHSDGKVELTATHVNPCFIHTDDSGTNTSLKKNEKTILKDGDKFSLLPNQYIYKLVLKDEKIKEESDKESEEETDGTISGEESEEESEPESDSENEESEEETPKKKRGSKADRSKTERAIRPRKAVKPSLKVDFINDDEDDEDYEEDDPDDDDDFTPEASDSDWEEEARGKKSNKKKRQPSSDDDSDEDYGKTKKKKSSSGGASKKGRTTTSGRRTSGRSTAPISKYVESDEDDD